MSILLSPIEKKAVNDFKKRLSSKYGNNLIVLKLFGSRARGDTHVDSDIDILIIVKRRTKQFDDLVIQLVCDILNIHGVYLETVTMTQKAYMNACRIQYPFVQNIEKDAVNI